MPVSRLVWHNSKIMRSAVSIMFQVTACPHLICNKSAKLCLRKESAQEKHIYRFHLFWCCKSWKNIAVEQWSTKEKNPKHSNHIFILRYLSSSATPKHKGVLEKLTLNIANASAKTFLSASTVKKKNHWSSRRKENTTIPHTVEWTGKSLYYQAKKSWS